MKIPSFLFSLFVAFALGGALLAADRDSSVYELRIYHAAPGKLEALEARFRDHTTRLFEKHGIKNVGYWIPVENPDNLLVYLVSYPSREAREASWKAFGADPEWQAAKAESEKEGKLVEKVDATFLTATDYSPAIAIESQSPAREFELRTYTTNDGKLADLDARFRDHTIALFQKHGMTSIGYFHPMEDQPAASTTLVYLLAHRDDEARKAGFKAFGQDPDWQAARKASEENGPLLIKGGVKSIPMMPTDFSPMK
ncbi:MAG: NIPSNAP family protein [Verrucomicrobiae bacterium]|nr:NIPSNAP family protein [Verrucomicrobiae bacterium]